jgi:glycosyltransferase involved in cell wall biosynthesis/ADP-heptose:LPS heptosyltransferase
MHLVVDMQGAQTGSRFRGIGRLTLSLVKAIVRHRGEHQVTLLLSGLFPESIAPLRTEFAGLLPDENFRVWSGVGPTQAIDAENNSRREVSERLREASLATLRPDVVLITSLFEGFTDNAVHSIGLLATSIPTAAILYDLIPLMRPGPEFQSNVFQQAWYQCKLETLRKCHRLLSISEYSRREAIMKLGLDEHGVDTISCGCDSSFRDLALTAEERNATSARYGIRMPFIMYTGGGDVSKNLGRLILAFARLDAGLRNQYELVFVGKFEPHDIDKLLAIASVSGMNADDLRFTGYVPDDDLIRLYNSCALFVFPSLHEGFGLPPLEAMACGAPVIASNSTSVAEVIGLPDALFDPLSIDGITEKLRVALTDDLLRLRLIAHGKKQAQALTWDKGAKLAWKSLLSLHSPSREVASSLLNVDRTGIFRKRLQRILVTKLDHLGDFILSIPALAKLRARYPAAQIDIVVGSWNVALAGELGYFREVFAFDYFKRKSSNTASTKEDDLSGLLQILGAYDIAIDLRRQPESRFLLVRTNAALKVGYQTFDQDIDVQMDVMLRSYKEGANFRTPLNNTPIALQLVRLVDALPDDVNDFVSLPTIVEDTPRLPGRIAIFPKAGVDAREWGRAKFTELVRKFLESSGFADLHVFFVDKGEAAEYGFADSLRLHVHVGLKFSALTQLLASSSLCIANNSGGIHLASYLGVPVVGIYSGHEQAAEWGPQFHDSVVLHRNAECSPCHLGSKADCPYGNFCLEDISVDDVYRKCVETLAAGTNSSINGNNSSAEGITLQLNDDAIVKDLIARLTSHLDATTKQLWIDVSIAIAHNHPNYSMMRESDLAYTKTVNTDLDHRSKVIEWLGFSGAEPHYRWSDGSPATMQFYVENDGRVPARARLLLVVDTFRRQRIIARFNGISVYDSVKTGRRILISLKVINLRSGLNRLELELPDAASPGNHDRRLLGVAVRKLRIVVGDGTLSGLIRRGVRLNETLIRWQ